MSGVTGLPDSDKLSIASPRSVRRLAFALAAILILLRLPLVSHPTPVHPDEVNFIAALGFPQPYPVHHPGYPLWVAMGTLTRSLGFSDYGAFQLWSFAASVGIPLLMVKRPYLRNEMSNWFGEYYDQMEIACTYNLIYNAAIMVKNHMGVALCIELESHFDDLCFRPLYPTLESGNVLVWKKEQTLPTATRAFIDYVKRCL